MMSESETIIRRAEQRDVPAITHIYNDAILNTTATLDLEPQSVADRLDWLQSHDERHPVLVIEVDGRVVGWGCLTEWSDRKGYEDTAEATVYVDPDFHNRGFGQQLNTAIIKVARELGFHTLIGRVAQGSDASLHLCARYGYQPIGTMREVGRKFGKLLDVHLFQKIL